MITDTKEKFYEMLSDFRTGMLVTHSDEKLLGRPMVIAQIDAIGNIWMISSEDTEKIDEVRDDSEVLITFQNDNGSYLSLSGQATTTQDHLKIHEVWKEPFKVWFPEGKDDPNIILIKVQPISGEYWNNEGFSKIKYLYEAAKAYVTNTTPEVDGKDQHGAINFKGGH